MKAKFKIVTAPLRDSPRHRSPLLNEFIEAVAKLKPGTALLVNALSLGWPKNTKSLTSRISHACKFRGVNVCTQTEKDGMVKVWLQRAERAQ